MKTIILEKKKGKVSNYSVGLGLGNKIDGAIFLKKYLALQKISQIVKI